MRSNPFIERLIGTIRREYPDQTLFWNATDLKRKLSDFQSYYNCHRTHSSLGGDTPAEAAGGASKLSIKLDNFRWQTYCRGLYKLPIAARVEIRQGHRPENCHTPSYICNLSLYSVGIIARYSSGQSQRNRTTECGDGNHKKCCPLPISDTTACGMVAAGQFRPAGQ